MSDSVDRVFAHALSTVKRIPRTGSMRPLPADRHRLYGLYKQSMEGDVEHVMKRPEGNGPEAEAEREKWDAWAVQHGLSRSEAKRQYITTLIETMHKYASSTPEARELVAELEFVWDQVKSHAKSSNSSSPKRPYGFSQSISQSPHQNPSRLISSNSKGESGWDAETESNLLAVRLVGYSDEGSNRIGDEHDQGGGQQSPLEPTHSTLPFVSSDPLHPDSHNIDEYELRNRKWRSRIEQALVKMTAEIAALRESLETSKGSRYPTRKEEMQRRNVRSWLMGFVTAVARHMIFDVMVLGIVIFWVEREHESMGNGFKDWVTRIRERWRGFRVMGWDFPGVVRRQRGTERTR